MVENGKEWIEKPLGLPSGSVRAIIALTMITVTSYILVFTGIDVPEWYQTVIAVIVGFYFGKAKT